MVSASTRPRVNSSRHGSRLLTRKAERRGMTKASSLTLGEFSDSSSHGCCECWFGTDIACVVSQ